MLAMLSAKRRLRVAPRGCALPLTAAARGALCVAKRFKPWFCNIVFLLSPRLLSGRQQ